MEFSLLRKGIEVRIDTLTRVATQLMFQVVMQDVRHIQELSGVIDDNEMFDDRSLFKVDQTGAYRLGKPKRNTMAELELMESFLFITPEPAVDEGSPKKKLKSVK